MAGGGGHHHLSRGGGTLPIHLLEQGFHAVLPGPFLPFTLQKNGTLRAKLLQVSLLILNAQDPFLKPGIHGHLVLRGLPQAR
jgi:hypothetical protein